MRADWNVDDPQLALSAVTYPSVVMVTMVYQNASGMLVNLVPEMFFSA